MAVSWLAEAGATSGGAGGCSLKLRQAGLRKLGCVLLFPASAADKLCRELSQDLHLSDLPLALPENRANRSEARKQDFLLMLKMMNLGNHRSTNAIRHSIGRVASVDYDWIHLTARKTISATPSTSGCSLPATCKAFLESQDDSGQPVKGDPLSEFQVVKQNRASCCRSAAGGCCSVLCGCHDV